MEAGMEDPIVASRFGYDSEICGMGRGRLMHGAMEALGALLARERDFKGGKARMSEAFVATARYLDDGSGIEVGIRPRWSFFEDRERVAPLGSFARWARAMGLREDDPSEAARREGWKALAEVAPDFDGAMQAWWDAQPALSDGLLAG